MSTEEAEETPEIPSNKSKFTPIIFTNGPEQSREHLSHGRQNLKKWLGRLVRVTLKNKLVLIGIFSCTDHDENLILTNCDAFIPDDEEPNAYGNVMVPGDQIVAFAVDMPLDLEMDTELEEMETEPELEEIEQTKSSEKSN